MRPALFVMAILMAIGATPAAAQGGPAPQAQVDAREVIHRGERLAVRVPAGAAYIGAERFVLYGISDCEIHLFVEADADRRIRRLYWVQFESYLPSRLDGRFNYGEIDPRMDLWGAAAWVRPLLVDTRTPPRAGSDNEHVGAMITRAGYTVPTHMAAVRLVRLLDDPQGAGYGRRELMLIYAEDLAASGVSPADATSGDAANTLREPLAGATVRAAAAAFQVEAR